MDLEKSSPWPTSIACDRKLVETEIPASSREVNSSRYIDFWNLKLYFRQNAAYNSYRFVTYMLTLISECYILPFSCLLKYASKYIIWIFIYTLAYQSFVFAAEFVFSLHCHLGIWPVRLATLEFSLFNHMASFWGFTLHCSPVKGNPFVAHLHPCQIIVGGDKKDQAGFDRDQHDKTQLYWMAWAHLHWSRILKSQSLLTRVNTACLFFSTLFSRSSCPAKMSVEGLRLVI